MTAVFALTLAASAALLFAVQPMVARMALPVLGGTPAVWNTCLVFFQAAVLGGYLLAHLLARRLCARLQAGIFLLLILAGAIALPVAIGGGEDASIAAATGEPVRWLLARLAGGVALPALALATASPLLQHWFARTAPGREPYRLYAASNAGSLGALLAYPAWIEPRIDLDVQARAWSVGYALWGVSLLACVAFRLRAERREASVEVRASCPEPPAAGQGMARSASDVPPSRRRVAAWIALGAVPASLLQGCTLFLTTDVASVPLLWIGPLALYLVTFIVAFSPRAGRVVAAANRALPFLASALVYVILSRATQPVGALMALHLGFLFAAGLVCHGRLVALRPDPGRLTGFYLALSLGGVLGGMFSALLAPRLFTTVAEYPLAIALACAALPARAMLRRRFADVPAGRGVEVTAAPGTWVADLAWGIGVGLAVVVLGLVLPWVTEGTPRLRDLAVFGLPAVACCGMLDRPRRLALAVGITFLSGFWLQARWTQTQHTERNFFGVTRVTRAADGRFHQLVHGNTVHGRQFTDPRRRGEPLAYYHSQGPLGRVFEEFRARPASRRVGVIGLGVGSCAAYARPEEDWTLFEIDPAVIRVARDPRWFTFLADIGTRNWRIREGDARLRLADESDDSFDLLLLDAFTSDAIPVHLVTREAFALYLRKLRPGGFIAVHISNRYLDLEPVLGAVARDAGLVCLAADDTDDDPAAGKEASHWAVLARSAADLGRLARGAPWGPAILRPGVGAWTDRRAGVLEVFQWH